MAYSAGSGHVYGQDNKHEACKQCCIDAELHKELQGVIPDHSTSPGAQSAKKSSSTLASPAKDYIVKGQDQRTTGKNDLVCTRNDLHRSNDGTCPACMHCILSTICRVEHLEVVKEGPKLLTVEVHQPHIQKHHIPKS